MSLEKYFGDWTRIIDIKELNKLMSKLLEEYKTKCIYPKQADVFKAFRLCSYKDCKVIFICQDPYPQKGVATGIALGNNDDTSENMLSPSLQVIKESVINFEIPHNFINFDPTLESWARQGVLMLNSALTIESNKIGSHIMLWRPFISKFLQNMCKYNTGIVYVLLGKQAQTFKPYLNNKLNYIIEVEHPAYFARIHKKMPHCIWQNINNKLYKLYGEKIEWFKEEQF